MTHYRKPVGVGVSLNDDGLEIVYVVCDDGSVWEYDHTRTAWLPLLPIPGSWADEADEADDP